MISIFAERLQNGLPISVFGDGEQTRDFFYVGDLLKLLLQALSRENAIEGAINVGLNQTTSLNELLSALADVVGKKPDVTYQAPRSGDIKHSRASNQRLLEHFTLDAPTPLRRGLELLMGQ